MTTQPHTAARPIVLIGYMGAGKTTIGRHLAMKLGTEFFDLDWYIENRFRLTVSQIFAQRGEDAFRRIERNMLHELAAFENIVLACGGGTPCFYDNMDHLTAHTDTVYLKASPETLQAHLLMGKSRRPLIEGKSPEELRAYIGQSLREREPYYRRAAHTVPIDIIRRSEQIDSYVAQIISLVRP